MKKNAPPPTKCPPLGFTFPVELVDVRDGDTVEVRLRGSHYVWAIRLADCWAPELHRGPEGTRDVARKAAQMAREILSLADEGDLRLFIPWPETGDKPINPLSLATFDRVVGFIYVGPSQTLNRMLVNMGLASTTKDGQLGQ